MTVDQSVHPTPVEGFGVETHDGLVFTVKGLVHPRDRVVAYLRYLADPQGERCRNGRRYRRVYHFDEQREALCARHLSYLAPDPMFGVVLQSVPRSDICRVYDPCRHLQHLLDSGPADSLEETALALTHLLAEAAHVPSSCLGVTGSLLLGLHQAASDVDLVVYGEVECRAVHQALRLLLADPSAALRRPRGEELVAVHQAHRPDTPLSLADFARHQAGKVNEGCFAGKPFFVRFVKRPQEVTERYGDPRYEPLGSATIEASVHDDRDALFTPCRYGVGDVSVREGPAVPGVREVISFRGRFSDQARTGEKVGACGRLERVVPGAGPSYLRLNVGGAPGEYLVGRAD